MSVTIKDIAREAGVSHSTVSRALRDHPAIKTETVQRIKLIAVELGYIPSAVARGLKTKRSLALGVIVSRIDDPFFSEILQGIEDVVRPAGYSLFVAASNRATEQEHAIVQAMGERRVDGLIISSTHVSNEHIQQLRDYGVPVVVVDNQSVEDYIFSIYHDDCEGSRRVTEHLIELGHHKIAYLGNRSSGRATGDRLLGYQKAMAAANLSIPDEYLISAPNGRPEGGIMVSQRILELPDRPTATVCFNDMMAFGVINKLQEAGLDIPGQISVTGFDNIELSALFTPPLTTFHQPKYQLGSEAARMMLDLLNPEKVPTNAVDRTSLILLGELIVRGSTAPPTTSSTL